MSGSLDAPTDGQANAQGQALAHRTAYLRKRMNPIGEVIMWVGSLSNVPYGYLPCNGSLVQRATYPELFAICGTAFGTSSSTNFRVPDLRGRFVRGADEGSERDPDRASRTAMATGGATGNNIGSVQGDEFKAHTHELTTGTSIGLTTEFDTTNGNSAGTPIQTSSTGGNETRPVNAYLNFIIKAYN
jgi:microcystin-dependent protein